MEQLLHISNNPTNKSAAKYLAVLIAVIERFAGTHTPVKYNDLENTSTLKNTKPATIRHYLLQLEHDKLLEKVPTSVGRIPTKKACRLYADIAIYKANTNKKLLSFNTNQFENSVSTQIAKCCDQLSNELSLPVFFSLPRVTETSIAEIHLFKVKKFSYVVVITNNLGSSFPKIVYSRHNFTKSQIDKITTSIKTVISPWGLTNLVSLSDIEANFANEICKIIMAWSLYGTPNYHALLNVVGLSKIYPHESTFAPNITLKTMHIVDNHIIQNNIIKKTLSFPSLQCIHEEDVDKIMLSDKPCFMTMFLDAYTLYNKPLGSVCVTAPWYTKFEHILFATKHTVNQISHLLHTYAQENHVGHITTDPVPLTLDKHNSKI